MSWKKLPERCNHHIRYEEVMTRIRIQRLESELFKLISNVVNFKMRDKKLRMINISAVKLSNDMSHAKIFFTSLDDTHTDKILQAFRNSKGFLKKEIAAAKFMRSVPELHFFYDETEENARHLDDLFARIKAESNNEDNNADN